MNITDRTTTRAVEATFGVLDIKLPKQLADAYARADKVATAMPSLAAQPGDLERSVTAAILAGREPASDAQVQRAVTAQALAANQGLSEAVTSATFEGIREVTHLDAIVTAWAKPFREAAQTLSAAHVRVGDHDLDDTAPIMVKGGDIAEVWAEAKTAEATIDEVLNGWVNLMTLVRVSLDARHRPLKLAALTLEQWTTLPAKLRPWDGVRAGLDLALPTLGEYRARIAAIEQERGAALIAADQPDAHRAAVQDWARRTAVGA